MKKLIDAKKFNHEKFWQLSIISLGLIALGLMLHGLLASPALVLAMASPKFKVGDNILVTMSGLNVRTHPSIFASNVGKQTLNASGRVVAGPIMADFNTWWKIDYKSGVDGWSAEKYLKLAPSISKPVTTSTRRLLKWGVFLGAGTSEDLSVFEQMVGKSANIQATFVGWGQPFPNDLASKLKLAGKTLVIFWEQYGTTLDLINTGDSDYYISQFALAARANGASIILAPMHEMNDNVAPWAGTVGSNTPAKVIGAWKHIHDGFIKSDNIKFAWDVNNVSVPNTPANDMDVYYPGDAYVDYVAVDGFNFSNQSWAESFPEGLIKQLSAYKKPIYILSTAAKPGPQKAQWIKDMGAQLRKYPNIEGWVWFHQNGADGNWLVDSDSTALSAFRSILP